MEEENKEIMEDEIKKVEDVEKKTKLMPKIQMESLSRNRTVAIEIGNEWLKILESTEDRIMKVFCKKLVEIKGTVGEFIGKTFSDLNFSKQGVVLCIPRHLVTVRMLDLPSTDLKEIGGMVNLQVGKQTPYSKDEIIFDHQIVGSGKEGYSRVMLVIVRRNLINDRIEVLQAAGVVIHRISVSSDGVYNWFALARPSQEEKEGEGVLVVDLDSNYSDINVIYKDRLVFTRNVLIGTKHLLGAREKWLERFMSEVAQARELFIHEQGGVRIAEVFLAGAAQSIADLDRLLSVQLELTVNVVSPIQNIRVRGDIDILQYEHFKFVSICPLIGIAMRQKETGFNLTPSELQIQRLMEERRRQVTLMGVLFAVIVMLISFLTAIYIYQKNTYLAQLKKKISGIQKEASAVEKMRLCINLVEGRLDVKMRTMNVLHEIYRLTPKEIHFTNINIEENKQAVLQGRAFAMSNVFEFVTTLESSPYFENVKTTYTTTKKEKKVEYAKFEIICVFEGGRKL